MSRIDGQRRDDRIQSAMKIFFEKSFLLTAHLFRPNQMNLFGRQLRHNGVEKTEMLLFGKFMNPLRDRAKRLCVSPAVRADAQVAGKDQALEPRYPHHKKFILN